MIPAHVSQREVAQFSIGDDQYRFLPVEDPVEPRKLCADCGKPVSKWAALRCHTCGLKARTLPIPKDFAEYMATHSQESAAEHYSMSISTVQRMCKDIGFRRQPGALTGSTVRRHSRPLPEWFMSEASTMTRDEIAARAKVTRKVVDRWVGETGVKCKVAQRFNFKKQNTVPERKADMSLAGRSADFLRPRWPNYRCNEDGQQNFNGKYWRFGTAVLTADEVIERAKRRGFDADAWMRIAA